MRWKPKPSSPDMPWWMWLFVPIWGPLAAIVIGIGAVIFGAIWTKRYLVGPSEEWRPWFAWYPVTVEHWPNEEKAFLEWIERRAPYFLVDATYRFPPKNDASTMINDHQ